MGGGGGVGSGGIGGRVGGGGPYELPSYWLIARLVDPAAASESTPRPGRVPSSAGGARVGAGGQEVLTPAAAEAGTPGGRSVSPARGLLRSQSLSVTPMPMFARGGGGPGARAGPGSGSGGGFHAVIPEVGRDGEVEGSDAAGGPNAGPGGPSGGSRTLELHVMVGGLAVPRVDDVLTAVQLACENAAAKATQRLLLSKVHETRELDERCAARPAQQRGEGVP